MTGLPIPYGAQVFTFGALSIEFCEEAWRRAMLRGDADTLEFWVDEHYIYVDPEGSLLSRAHDLRAHRAKLVRIDRFDVLDFQISEYDDTAVVCMLVDLAGAFRSAAFSGQVRMLRTWARREGHWRLVSSAAVNVPAPSEI
ncbi:MAG TPA: nuclear transport factor 2 family protein [Polyangiaceae bacterium]|nr:nuclear transport factor 2 family protein [Polyangiaceae bacterium]